MCDLSLTLRLTGTHKLECACRCYVSRRVSLAKLNGLVPVLERVRSSRLGVVAAELAPARGAPVPRGCHSPGCEIRVLASLASFLRCLGLGRDWLRGGGFIRGLGRIVCEYVRHDGCESLCESLNLLGECLDLRRL
jgi:hypothetical protein